LESDKQKASEEEILSYLVQIVAPAVKDIVIKAGLLIGNNKGEALAILNEYDSTLGGIGIYSFTDKRHLGVYRSLYYVKLGLSGSNVKESTRQIIISACGYLEELLKKVVHSWFWERLKPDGLPLGTLVNRYKRHLPSALANNLFWLCNSVYNLAKHKYNFEDENEEPLNFFSIEEAIAVYFICRKLGLELEQFIGKSQDELAVEYS
jgi:hypothetical protein